MTRIAQLFLVITSLAPIAFVQAAVYAQRRAWPSAIGLVVAAALMLALSRLLLRGVRTSTNEVPKLIENVSRRDSEPLAFFVAYALPLVAAKTEAGGYEFGLVAFALVVGLVLWQQQTFHVNPLLALTGISFLTCHSNGVATLLVSNTVEVRPGELDVYPLSERVWLHWQSAGSARGGGVSGLPTRDSGG